MVNYDAFGPEKIVQVYHPKSGMRGVVVIDSTALGPGKGGIRMTPSVSVEEVARLARTMTWKNAMAELPFGGAKSGIIFNPRQATPQKKQEIVQAFARALKPVSPSLYVAAPDMNMAEEEMISYVKGNGSRKSVTGKPEKLGGLPHELGSTGFGVYHAAKIALEHIGKNMDDITVAIEGFGNVGTFAAEFLAKDGAKIVAVSDSSGVIFNNKGLDVKKVEAVKKNTRKVTAYKDGKILPSHAIISQKVDVLITAAIPDLISAGEINDVKAKVIVEGSNIPMTAETEGLFHRRGTLVVPDFVANAGGVISSYVEYTGKDKKYMFKLVEKKIRDNTELVLSQSKNLGCPPREVAMDIARERVLAACHICDV